jgi:alpha-D-ribose 1-methylphosphonate 5-triphosphate synthase subunit PhnG
MALLEQNQPPKYDAIKIGWQVVMGIALAGGLLILGSVLSDRQTVRTTEVHCIAGYSFIQNKDGSKTQIISEFGKGVPCIPAYK